MNDHHQLAPNPQPNCDVLPELGRSTHAQGSSGLTFRCGCATTGQRSAWSATVSSGEGTTHRGEDTAILQLAEAVRIQAQELKRIGLESLLNEVGRGLASVRATVEQRPSAVVGRMFGRRPPRR
jgi:hypothetical protein